MAQRELVRPQLVLERGAEYAALDARRARDAVDLEYAIELAEIERDDARVAVADARFDAAHDARPAAIRNAGGAGAGAPIEHRGDLALVARERDLIGRGREIAAQRAHHVAKSLAIGVAEAIVRRCRADRAQRRGRLHVRRRERDLVFARHRREIERGAESLRQRPRDAEFLLGGRAGVLVAPTPELAPARAHEDFAGASSSSTFSSGTSGFSAFSAWMQT